MIADDDNKISILELSTLKIVGGWMMQRKILCSTGSNHYIFLSTQNNIGVWKWNSEKVHNFEL